MEPSPFYSDIAGRLAAVVAELPAWAWAAMAVLVVLGSILQVGAGVGFGSLVAPGTMLVAPALMPATVICLSFASASLGAARLKGGIAYREVAIAVAGRALGAAAASWLIVRIGSREGFALLFAALTLLGVMLSRTRWQVRVTTPVLIVAGFLSGLMATVTTIGGPPMALVYQSREAALARPTLNMFFAIGTLPPIAALWAAGILDLVSVGRAVLLLPAVLVGVGLSHLATRFIDRRYRTILLVFCIAAALIIGGKAILQLMGA
jgi:uncharacterized membrane protein YfcA